MARLAERDDQLAAALVRVRVGGLVGHAPGSADHDGGASTGQRELEGQRRRPAVQALQRAYLDPAVNLLLVQLRRRLQATEKTVERLRDEIEAAGGASSDPKYVKRNARSWKGHGAGEGAGNREARGKGSKKP